MSVIACHLDCLHIVSPNDELTELSTIAPMQRRRLSALAKLALHAARRALGGASVDVIIWSSCCGDEAITAQILSDIAAGETPSPTLFSVSVHNAIAGLYSILYDDDTPATCLACTPDTAWSDTIIEAYTTLITTGTRRALVVYYDAPLPDIYDDAGAAVSAPLAVAALVSVDTSSHLQPNLQIDTEQDIRLSVSDFITLWQGGVSYGAWARL